MKNLRRSQVRRGTAAVAVIIALVLLQLAVAGMVLGGARDHDLSARRLDTVRAFYAAEAGANMAVRELMSNADADADGAIGSISNDSNLTDDPLLGAARVYVTKSVAGSVTTISSRGRSGDATRQIQLTLQ